MRYGRPSKYLRIAAEINVVPFIDVMLVLLVIFMITTPLLHSGVKVDLPEAKAKAIMDNEQPIIVSIDAYGRYYTNIAPDAQEALLLPQLQELLRREMSNVNADAAKQRPVLIRGDHNVSYGIVARAMAALQEIGVKNLALLTKDYEKNNLSKMSIGAEHNAERNIGNLSTSVIHDSAVN